MKEKDIWNFFLLTGNIDSYLTYRCVKGMADAEFAKEDEELSNGKSNGNNNKDS